MHTCIHAYMHTHTHTHRYPHTYIHTHTHTDIHVLLHIIIIITMVLACLSCCWLCWCHPLIGFTARYFSAPRSKPISWTCLCLTNWKRMCCGSSSRGLYYHTFTLIRLCVVFFVASVCLPACLPSCLSRRGIVFGARNRITGRATIVDMVKDVGKDEDLVKLCLRREKPYDVSGVAGTHAAPDAVICVGVCVPTHHCL